MKKSNYPVIMLIFMISTMTFQIKNYSITGSGNIVNISNSISSKGPELQQNHTLSPPIIISPQENEIVNGTIRVSWTNSIDSDGHTVRYTVLLSQDGVKWKNEASNIQQTNIDWDTTETKWCAYYIKVIAECSIGLTNEDTIKVRVRNFPLELRDLLILLLFIIIILLLVGIIFYRKHHRGSTIGDLLTTKDLKIGLCLGSFTDKGLIIKKKNSNCPFSPKQIQPMLEYSAALYQHGKAGTMYGPIPLTSLKEEIPEIEPSQTHWRFVTYWMNVRDSTVEDPRVRKIGGVVSAVLLVFYPKQLDQMVMVKKNYITDIFNTVIESQTDISEFTIEDLTQIEDQLMKLFIS